MTDIIYFESDFSNFNDNYLGKIKIRTDYRGTKRIDIEGKLIRIKVKRKYRYFVETEDGCRVHIDGRYLKRSAIV